MVHLFHSLHFFMSEKTNLRRNTPSADCYFSSNWKSSSNSSATKHLRKNITKWDTLGFMSKTFLKELLMFSLPLHMINAGNRWQGLYLNIYIYTRTSTNIYIHICIKRQNSWFESWTQWEHTALDRAGLWLLSWAGALEATGEMSLRVLVRSPTPAALLQNWDRVTALLLGSLQETSHAFYSFFVSWNYI